VSDTKSSVKEIYIDTPKEEFLLKTAERLKPESIDDSINVIEKVDTDLKDAKVALGFLIKPLLERITLFLGLAWTPLSLFISISQTALAEHLKQKEVDDRLNNTRALLNQFTQIVKDLNGPINRLIDASVVGATDYDESVKIYKLLEETYVKLIALKDIGEKIDSEVSANLSKIEAVLEENFSISNKHYQKEIDYIRFTELTKFKHSLNTLRALIRKIER